MKSEQREPTSRLFTAIPLTEPVRQYVSSIAGALKPSLEGVKWVGGENLHVTLRFIGDCPDAKVPALVEWMTKAAANLPLELAIGGVGGFPSQGSARVLWVGAQDSSNAIEKVYNVLDKGAGKCGFGREGRKYKAHITIGRARKSPVRIPPEIVEKYLDQRVALKADEIVLFKSVLSSTGAEYSVVERTGPPAEPE
ncbi:MAG: RNA 2',3'-cyclic phosphodiesterase [Candidatus Geothermincolia bacterium]